MRLMPKALLRAAAAMSLATFGFIEPPGSAFADDVPPKIAQEAARKIEAAAREIAQVVRNIGQEDAVVQQFEQQFAGQFRQLYKTELHFMRLVSQPTKQQYEKISADGETALKATIRNFALQMNGLRQPRASAGEQSDPRPLIADALAKSARTILSREQAARYQKELHQRTAARKRVVVLNLVAKFDKVLVLTAEQR